MNKNCIYMDDKVIITDENGNYTVSEYYDNLDKVLVQENVIEEMEKRIQKLTKESKKNPFLEKKYIPIYLYPAIIAPLVAPPLAIYSITGNNPYLCYIDTVFGSVNEVLFHSLLVFVLAFPFCSGLTLLDYFHNYKPNIKKAQGINSELKFLENQIEKEKEILFSLQEVKTKDKDISKLKSTEVDDIQQLEELKSRLMLYNNLGSNRKKYLRYYKQGKLEQKMQKHYSETDIKLAKEFLEEKGPVLVRKRNNNE